LVFAGSVQIQRVVTVPAFSHALSQRLRVALDVGRSLCGFLSHFVRAGVLRSTSNREQQQNDGESIDYFHHPTMHAESGRLVLSVVNHVFVGQDEP